MNFASLILKASMCQKIFTLEFQELRNFNMLPQSSGVQVDDFCYKRKIIKNVKCKNRKLKFFVFATCDKIMKYCLISNTVQF